MTVQQLPRLATRASLVLAPLLWLLSTPFATAAMANSDAGGVAAIAHHPDRFYAFTLLTLIGTMLVVPAVAGLADAARARAPLATFLGAGLFQLGALVGVGDSTTQLLYWQTSRGDPPQMAALLHRYESAPGANLVFMVGGLSLIAGSLLLALALRRARVAPPWAVGCVPLGMVANIVSFAAHSLPLLAGSSAILLAGFGWIAAERTRACTPAPAAASA